MKPLSNHLDVRALLEFTSRFEHYTAFYNNILIIDKSFLLTDTCFPEYRFPGCEIALKIKTPQSFTTLGITTRGLRRSFLPDTILPRIRGSLILTASTRMVQPA